VRGAHFVGSDAGAIVVSVEMPDLSTLAKVDELQRSNPEIAAVIAKIAGLRKIMSDSLYEDFRPSICVPRHIIIGHATRAHARAILECHRSAVHEIASGDDDPLEIWGTPATKRTFPIQPDSSVRSLAVSRGADGS
jgi:hypothetical protein